jgi:hypothetical protein
MAGQVGGQASALFFDILQRGKGRNLLIMDNGERLKVGQNVPCGPGFHSSPLDSHEVPVTIKVTFGVMVYFRVVKIEPPAIL